MHRGLKIVESNLVWFHRIIDGLVPTMILYITMTVYSTSWHDRYLIIGFLGGLIFIFISQANGAYRNWNDPTYLSGIKTIFKSWLWTWAALIVLAFLYKDTQHFSRVAIATWAIFTPIGLITYRILVKSFLIKYRQNSSFSRNVAIVGAGKVGQHIANLIKTNSWLGYNLVAYFDDNPKLAKSHINGVPILGGTDDVLPYASKLVFDEIYICLPLRSELVIKTILNQLTDTTVIVKYIPDLFTFDLMHARWSEINGIPVISVYDSPLSSRTVQLIKRFEDLVLSLIILVMISPILVAISIGVKLTSPGPIIFKQRRYGLNGKEIKVYKFRSMRCAEDNGEIIQATKNDKRITSFGAFLRKTSLDELPQFFNVLQGKMSIVGPRPHAVAHNELYRKLVPKYMQRHLVKPGITGWAQINGWRGETETLEKMEKRIEFDLHYINNWSLWLDFKIITLTAIKGFIHKNAY